MSMHDLYVQMQRTTRFVRSVSFSLFRNRGMQIRTNGELVEP